VIDRAAIDELREIEGAAVRLGVPLGELTSFGIGGPAAALAEVSDARALGRAIGIASAAGLEVLVLGGGTNILASDDGFDGLVIRPSLRGISVAEDGRSVTAGASVPASLLVDHLVERGLCGLEFAAGLPGTVGGAIAGNAGCFGCTFGERLLAATVVDRAGRSIRVDDPADFGFEYRGSSVATAGWIVAEVTLEIAPGDRTALAATAQGHKETRRQKHPAAGSRTAGSYFKNLPPDRENGLTGRMASAVRARFGVALEAEVRFVGRRPAIGS